MLKHLRSCYKLSYSTLETNYAIEFKGLDFKIKLCQKLQQPRISKVKKPKT